MLVTMTDYNFFYFSITLQHKTRTKHFLKKLVYIYPLIRFRKFNKNKFNKKKFCKLQKKKIWYLTLNMIYYNYSLQKKRVVLVCIHNFNIKQFTEWKIIIYKQCIYFLKKWYLDLTCLFLWINFWCVVFVYFVMVASSSILANGMERDKLTKSIFL